MNKNLIFGLALITSLLVGCSEAKPTTSSSPNSSYVDQDVHVESVTIKNKDKTTFKVGESISLEIEVLPKNATNQLVHYSSSDESVAYVSIDNVLHARKKGTCKITVTSDDGNKVDTMDISVIDSTVTDFQVAFKDQVDTIQSGVNTFYKLILNQSYPLEITFTSTDPEDEQLEVSFSLDGFVEYQEETKSLLPLKRTDSLTVTFKAKGTDLKKEIFIKVVSEGEKDVSEALNILKASYQREKNLNISSYQFDFEFDYDKLQGTKLNRYHTIQTTKYDIYKQSSNRYMLGTTHNETEVTLEGASTSTKSTIDSRIFKGMSDDGNYYEFQVNQEGKHLTTPLKKAIVNEISDKNTQTTRELAIQDSTRYTMNSHVGLSAIGYFHFSGLYENSLGFTSLPMYFGMGGLTNLKITGDAHQLKAETYFIEERPSNVSNGKVFFNTGIYDFDDNENLISIDVTSYVYDSTSFDFNTETLKENPTYYELYKTKYTQTYGDLKTQETNDLDPQNLYFNDYTPILTTANGTKVTEYKEGQTYYLSFENPNPSIATNLVDGLFVDDASDKNVVQILDNGKAIKILKSGVSQLTIYSSKNQIEKTLMVNVGVTMPSSISIEVNKESKDSVQVQQGEKLEPITFKVLPEAASQEVEVTLNGVGAITKNQDGSYSFISNEVGSATLTVTSKLDKNISKSLAIEVTKKDSSASFIDVLLASTYASSDDSLTESNKVQLAKISFVSKNKARFSVTAMRGFEAYEYIFDCDITIDETNKTITFNSLTLTNDDYSEYTDDYSFPVIETGIAYQIEDDARALHLKLICIYEGKNDGLYDNNFPLNTFNKVA